MNLIEENDGVIHIGYKGFDRDLKSKGFQYEVGKTYAARDSSVNYWGFSFFKTVLDCTYYNKTEDDSRYCEIIAFGDVLEEDDSIISEYIASNIYIVRELSSEEVSRLCNYGDFNHGSRNIGLGNIGHKNIGWDNEGNCNIGDFNIGDSNYGHSNKGENNIGYFNIGDNCIGAFNTEAAEVYTFNKPSGLTLKQWKEEYADIFTGYSLENLRANSAVWSLLPREIKEKTFSLPNFDLEIFESTLNIAAKDDYNAYLSTKNKGKMNANN